MEKQTKKDNRVNDEIKEAYSLKTEAVDELVDVLKKQEKEEASPKQHIKEKPKQGEKHDPYKNDWLGKIPTWVKVCFVKFWIAGAICYFFYWGIGIYIRNMLDLIVIGGIATGIIMDVFVNSAFLHFESDKKEYHSYMLLPVSCKKVWTLFINVPYGLLEVFLIVQVYALFNKNISDTLGVEPILYGLLFVIIDMAFISIKNLIVKLIKHIKNKRKIAE